MIVWKDPFGICVCLSLHLKVLFLIVGYHMLGFPREDLKRLQSREQTTYLYIATWCCNKTVETSSWSHVNLRYTRTHILANTPHPYLIIHGYQFCLGPRNQPLEHKPDQPLLWIQRMASDGSVKESILIKLWMRSKFHLCVKCYNPNLNRFRQLAEVQNRVSSLQQREDHQKLSLWVLK